MLLFYRMDYRRGYARSSSMKASVSVSHQHDIVNRRSNHSDGIELMGKR